VISVSAGQDQPTICLNYFDLQVNYAEIPVDNDPGPRRLGFFGTGANGADS
jgi:hypothetical protein